MLNREQNMYKRGRKQKRISVSTNLFCGVIHHTHRSWMSPWLGGGCFRVVIPDTDVAYTHEDAHTRRVKRGGDTNTHSETNCSLLHALAPEARGITEDYTHHILNRDTATHLHFCVLFNFYILLIWLLLLMKTSVYIRVHLVKRTRRRTDGKTFVNIIIRQHSRFSGYPHALC